MVRRRCAAAYAVALAAAALTVSAGCGSDNTAGGGATAQPATAARPEAPASVRRITDFASYVGGNPGKATGKPVVIGFINSEGGQVSFPAVTRAAQASARYINEELGGVQGRPIKLKTCFVASAEEEGQRCGQLFVNDDDVVAVNAGILLLGNQAFHRQMHGTKPVVFGVAPTPFDTTAANTYALFGSGTSLIPSYATFARDVLRAKTAAIVYPNIPGAIPTAAATRAGLQDAGVKFKSVGYDAGATDLVGPITAAGGQTANVLIPQLDPAGCVNFAKALAQSGIRTPVISNPQCLNQQVAKALGDLPHWTFGVSTDIPTDATNPTSRAYQAVMRKYGVSAADASDIFSALAFADLLATTKAMNRIKGPITPAAVSRRLSAFRGPLVLGPATIHCGEDPKAPAVCNDQTQFFRYEGRGVFKRVSDFLRPPA